MLFTPSSVQDKWRWLTSPQPSGNLINTSNPLWLARGIFPAHTKTNDFLVNMPPRYPSQLPFLPLTYNLQLCCLPQGMRNLEKSSPLLDGKYFSMYGNQKMVFLDVEFLPCRAGFYTTFQKHRGRGQVHGTATCLDTVAEVKSTGQPHVLILWLGSCPRDSHMSWYCGWVQVHGTATCLDTVAGVKSTGQPHVLILWLGSSPWDSHVSWYSGWGKQGHAPCKIFLLKQILFLCQFKFGEDHKTVTTLRWIWPPSASGDITGCYNTVVSAVCQSLRIIRLSQHWGESGHPQLVGILPDWKHYCLSVQDDLGEINDKFWHSLDQQ